MQGGDGDGDGDGGHRKCVAVRARSVALESRQAITAGSWVKETGSFPSQGRGNSHGPAVVSLSARLQDTADLQHV